MRRFLVSTALASVAVLLSACGSSDSGGSGATNNDAASAGGAPIVSVAAVSGVGNILIDATGRPLYSPDQEADGTVLCVDTCTSTWVPLAPGASALRAGGGAPAPTVVDRPDGTKQVAVAGRPLYTFASDAVGKVSGDGVADDFAGQHFTWHVVMSDGTLKAVALDPKAPSPYAGD
jgi:predicted lipoprotein with Yx(FWY)xxD motif